MMSCCCHPSIVADDDHYLVFSQLPATLLHNEGMYLERWCYSSLAGRYTLSAPHDPVCHCSDYIRSN